jgi:hypothetical protein
VTPDKKVSEKPELFTATISTPLPQGNLSSNTTTAIFKGSLLNLTDIAINGKQQSVWGKSFTTFLRKNIFFSVSFSSLSITPIAPNPSASNGSSKASSYVLC